MPRELTTRAAPRAQKDGPDKVKNSEKRTADSNIVGSHYITSDQAFSIDDLERFALRGWPMFPVYKIRDGQCVCQRGRDCDSPGKHPMIHNGVKGATLDPVLVGQWFRMFPGCNWAVATGEASGAWVLDVDTHEHDGIANMKDWLTANDLTIPETFTVFTGGGGWHFYFRVDEPLKNRGGVLPGVDVRATGGYVLLPGSNHVSGGSYLTVSDAPLARAPRKLTEFLKTAGSSSSSMPSGGSAGRGISTALDQYLTNGFTPGNRDNECYHLACSLWRKYWNDPEFVEAAIADCWRATQQGDAPFPWTQAKRKIAEAYKFVKSSKESEDQFLRQHGGIA